MSSGSSDSGDGPSPFPTALRLSSNRPPASSDYTPPRRPTLAKNPDCCVFEVSRALSADAGTCGLVDRHTQEAKLTDFVVSHVKGGKAGVLYVCGAPGTGKTATTSKVLGMLQDDWPWGTVAAPTFTCLNAMQCHDPRSVYARILASIGHKSKTKSTLNCKDSEEALVQALTASGKGGKHRMHVVCIDEIDALNSANQAVLYRLFQLPLQPHSTLILLGIANTINLPEILVPKLATVTAITKAHSSRMKRSRADVTVDDTTVTECEDDGSSVPRLLFEPYTEEQLCSIVSSRCNDVMKTLMPPSASTSARVRCAGGDGSGDSDDEEDVTLPPPPPVKRRLLGASTVVMFGGDEPSTVRASVSSNNFKAVTGTSTLPSSLGSTVFHPAALRLCGRKVSQKNAGDARKVLEVAGVAVTLAKQRHVCQRSVTGQCCWSGPLVTIADVSAAFNEVYASVSVRALANYPIAVQALVCSIVSVLSSVGTGVTSLTKHKSATVTIAALRTHHNAFCKRNCLKPPESTAFIELLERLQSDGVISIGSGKDLQKRCLSLCVDVSDVESMLGGLVIWGK